VIGYSEGSTEGASVAQKIVEKGLGKLTAFTSIGGAGLVGKKDQTETDVLAHFEENSSNLLQNRKKYSEMPKTFSEVGQDTFLINHRMIGDKEQGGYENSLGNAYVDTGADVRNIAKWGMRYLKSSLGIEEEVPHERVQAVFSKNEDFEKLAASGVPIVILAGSKEIMFPAADVQRGVEGLRAMGGKVLLLVTDMGHGFPHENPSGTAMTLELFRRKAGI
jgi:pimeloyl-ACP methyl ester carboxylesterase